MTTKNETDGCLELTGIDADWDYTTQKPSTWPDNPRLMSIEFHPGATSDVLWIKQEQDTGVTRFYANCNSVSDSRVKYFHGSRCKPFIDHGSCTLSAGHKVIIELWRKV